MISGSELWRRKGGAGLTQPNQFFKISIGRPFAGGATPIIWELATVESNNRRLKLPINFNIGFRLGSTQHSGLFYLELLPSTPGLPSRRLMSLGMTQGMGRPPPPRRLGSLGETTCVGLLARQPAAVQDPFGAPFDEGPFMIVDVSRIGFELSGLLTRVYGDGLHAFIEQTNDFGIPPRPDFSSHLLRWR